MAAAVVERLAVAGADLEQLDKLEPFLELVVEMAEQVQHQQ
jgi:hypothetical protein